MTIEELLQSAAKLLGQKGIENPDVDAQLLLGHCLGVSRTELHLKKEESVSPEDKNSFEVLLLRRLQREPFAYITGEKEFWSLPFYVNRSVLIPRPETEILIEKIIKTLSTGESAAENILDLGAGSGIIACVLAREFPSAMITAVDISYPALQVAQQNVLRHKLKKRISLLRGNWLKALSAEPRFNLVVSNPPYIPSSSIESLQPEVSSFEPKCALDGGGDGLTHIKNLAEKACHVLRPGGWFFMEIGSDQGSAVASIFHNTGSYDTISIAEDYAGLDRILSARKK